MIDISVFNPKHLHVKKLRYSHFGIKIPVKRSKIKHNTKAKAKNKRLTMRKKKLLTMCILEFSQKYAALFHNHHNP